MLRLELILLVAASTVWLLAALALFGVVPLAGTLDVGLYRLYSVAAVLGWVTGNVYLVRLRYLRLPREPLLRFWRQRFLFAYLVGPPGVLYLLRALAPVPEQKAAPFVPVYALGVYAIFFLVPVTLRPPPRRRPG